MVQLPGYQISIALIVAYFGISVYSGAELYIFKIRTESGMQISYRVAFYLFLIVLCLIRIIQMLCVILIVRADIFVRVNFFFQIYGDVAFFACFMALKLAFINALKLQFQTIGKVARIFSLSIFIVVCIVQTALFITFEQKVQGPIDFLIQNRSETFGPAPNTTFRNVDTEDELLAIDVTSNLIYRGSVAIFAGFAVIFACTFFSVTLLVYFTLRGGDILSSNNSLSGKIKLTIRILLLNVFVTFFLLSRVVYVTVRLVRNLNSRPDLYFGITFIMAEIAPVLIFLLFLFMSRTHMSTNQNSQTDKSQHSVPMSSAAPSMQAIEDVEGQEGTRRSSSAMESQISIQPINHQRKSSSRVEPLQEIPNGSNRKSSSIHEGKDNHQKPRKTSLDANQWLAELSSDDKS